LRGGHAPGHWYLGALIAQWVRSLQYPENPQLAGTGQAGFQIIRLLIVLFPQIALLLPESTFG